MRLTTLLTPSRFFATLLAMLTKSTERPSQLVGVIQFLDFIMLLQSDFDELLE
jgi:hypothetical protein